MEPDSGNFACGRFSPKQPANQPSRENTSDEYRAPLLTARRGASEGPHVWAAAPPVEADGSGSEQADRRHGRKTQSNIRYRTSCDAGQFALQGRRLLGSFFHAEKGTHAGTKAPVPAAGGGKAQSLTAWHTAQRTGTSEATQPPQPIP